MADAFVPKPGCDVPVVEKIEPIIVGAELCDPPGRIFEFPAFEFPPFVPPGFDFGCTAPRTQVTLTNQNDPAFEVTIVTDEERGPCDPLFDILVGIPNCVDLNAAINVSQARSASATIVTNKGENPCSQDIAIDFQIPPCVTMSTSGSLSTPSSGAASMSFVAARHETDPCNWNINLDLVIPSVGGGTPSTAGLCEAKLATTTNLPVLSGLLTVDGVASATNDVILVKNQTDKKQNGLYKANATGWQRDVNCSLSSGLAVTVRKGTANHGTAWVLTNEDPVSVGSDDINFEELGESCCCNARVATTGNIALTGLQTIDTIAVAADDIVLVRAQTNAAENGTYTVASGAWSRTCAIVPGMVVSVREGKALIHTLWILKTNAPITLDTTLLTWQWAHNGHLTANVSSDILGTGTGARDGTAVTTGDKCLVFNAAANNGLYFIQAGTWARLIRFDTTSDPGIIGTVISVANGTRRGSSHFIVAASDTLRGMSPYLAAGTGL